jgi:hypothetical protein
MKQFALTLILPIAGDENAAWLDKELTAIGQQLGKAPKIDFSKSSLTHFARFVILPAADPDSKAKRLLFTSNLDGDLNGYAKELIDKGIAPGLDAIFSKCEGYKPGTLLTEGNTAAFLNSNTIDSHAFYVALRGATLDIIQESAGLRIKIDRELDKGEVNADNKANIDLLFKECEALRKASSCLDDPPPTKKSFWAPFLAVLNKVWEWLVGIRYDGNDPQITVKTHNGLYDMEDLVTQNQLTVVVPVKKNFFSRFLLRLILWIISIQVKSVKGTLLDLATIHFARWVIIDKGDNILFESNFDGSWENYIDDFVDHASAGMNLIWGNCIGFPRGGAKDIEAFKAYIRENQSRSQVYYSAYKGTTVRNILTDLSLSKKIPELTRPDGVADFAMGYYGS